MLGCFFQSRLKPQHPLFLYISLFHSALKVHLVKINVLMLPCLKTYIEAYGSLYVLCLYSRKVIQRPY